jgi:hypothetical protein
MTRGKHVTIPKGVTRAVRWIEAQPDVERMVFGKYKPRKRAKNEVDVVGPCNGGLKIVARGEDLAMEMFLHTRDPEGLAGRIGERFGRTA